MPPVKIIPCSLGLSLLEFFKFFRFFSHPSNFSLFFNLNKISPPHQLGEGEMAKIYIPEMLQYVVLSLPNLLI